MKNYFTDSQVRELHEQFCKSNAVPLLLLKNITAGDVNHLRNLINLAVEAAIGLPVASEVPKLIDLSKSTRVHFSRTKEGMHLTDDELKKSINGTVARSLFPLYEADYYVEDKHGVKHYSTPLYSVK